MACTYNFSKLRKSVPRSEYVLKSWTPAQDAIYNKLLKNEGTTNFRKALYLFDSRCQRDSKADALTFFELYVLSKYPKKYEDWMEKAPKEILKDLMKTPEKYLYKFIFDGDEVIDLKGDENYPSEKDIAKFKSAWSTAQKRESVKKSSPKRKSTRSPLKIKAPQSYVRKSSTTKKRKSPKKSAKRKSRKYNGQSRFPSRHSCTEDRQCESRFCVSDFSSLEFSEGTGFCA